MRSSLRRVLREPLFHFVVAGALLFVFAQWLASSREAPRAIIVDRPELDRLKQQWEAQYGSAPTSEQTAALLRSHVRDEILYREALELGLDRDDVIIRRRLVQKFRFLTEGLSELAEPDESELRQFYEAHRDQYERPAETSFQHIYFSSDNRGEEAQRDALGTVRRLKTSPAASIDWRRLGDPSILQREYAQRSDRELAELFGAQFVDALREIEPGPWAGPIPSIYGWHGLRVRERSPRRTPAFSAVREAVRADWLAERRAETNESLHRALRDKYEVEWLGVPDPGPPAEPTTGNPEGP